MRALFSAESRVRTWRRLWIALAEAQQELGLAITDAQLDELRRTAADVDFAAAARHEERLRHDVMAHVHAWGEVAPGARGILHLGATSCFVTDNADLVLMREGLRHVRAVAIAVIQALREFAIEWRALPVLGLTHLQPAQATTLGKRACLWIQDLAGNLADLDHVEGGLRFRGAKGTTGTQASFLELFDGDHGKVRALDRAVTRKMGFERTFGVTGQTYPRQLDFRVCQVLSGIAQSASKFAVDVRLAAAFRELEEPFGEGQVGSSAMPWKRNPMRCERMASLARRVMHELGALAETAAQQWFERTLDDSAVRRLAIPECFLGADAILQLWLDVARGLVVHPEGIRRRLEQELPFLATERLLMAAVKGGADRQDAHEQIRLHSRAAAEAVHRGEPNPLCALLGADPLFAGLAARFDALLDPASFVGRAPEQVEEYLEAEVDPLLRRHADLPAVRSEVRV
jgi:adenylosuccinate lyase